MTRKKSKTHLVRGWLEKARRDLVTAQDALKKEEVFTDLICFHAQQATEKVLKGYLLHQQIDFPKVHNLGQLVDLAAMNDKSFAQLRSEAEKLSSYAIETRYPEFVEPSIQDAKEAIKIAKEITNFVRQKLPQKSIPLGWKK